MAATTMQRYPGGAVQRSSSSGLAEVVDLILDKGLVIDVFVRVSLVGIELITIDARIVIASVDTYLRFAEAVNRIDLTQQGGETLPELMEDVTEGGAKSKTVGVLEGAKEKLFGSDEGGDDEGDGSKSSPSRRSSSSRSSSRSGGGQSKARASTRGR